MPLTIADKNRCFAYELTIAGTLLATVNCMYYIGVGLLAEVMINFQGDDGLSEAWNRVIITIFIILSNVFLYGQAKKEFLQFR